MFFPFAENYEFVFWNSSSKELAGLSIFPKVPVGFFGSRPKSLVLTHDGFYLSFSAIELRKTPDLLWSWRLSALFIGCPFTRTTCSGLAVVPR